MKRMLEFAWWITPDGVLALLMFIVTTGWIITMVLVWHDTLRNREGIDANREIMLRIERKIDGTQ